MMHYSPIKEAQRKRFPVGSKVRLVKGWRDLHKDHKVIDHLILKDDEVYTVKDNSQNEHILDSISLVLEGKDHSGYIYTATWFEPASESDTLGDVIRETVGEYLAEVYADLLTAEIVHKLNTRFNIRKGTL